MNNISDLRTTLSDVIALVKAGDMDTDRAKTINELCKTVIDSAKTEVDYCRVTGAMGSGFIDGIKRPAGSLLAPIQPGDIDTLAGSKTHVERDRNGARVITTAPGVTRTVHTMTGAR